MWCAPPAACAGSRGNGTGTIKRCPDRSSPALPDLGHHVEHAAVQLAVAGPLQHQRLHRPAGAVEASDRLQRSQTETKLLSLLECFRVPICAALNAHVEFDSGFVCMIHGNWQSMARGVWQSSRCDCERTMHLAQFAMAGHYVKPASLKAAIRHRQPCGSLNLRRTICVRAHGAKAVMLLNGQAAKSTRSHWRHTLGHVLGVVCHVVRQARLIWQPVLGHVTDCGAAAGDVTAVRHSQCGRASQIKRQILPPPRDMRSWRTALKYCCRLRGCSTQIGCTTHIRQWDRRDRRRCSRNQCLQTPCS